MGDWFYRRLESVLDNAIFAGVAAVIFAIWSFIKTLPAPIIALVAIISFASILLILRVILSFLDRRKAKRVQGDATTQHGQELTQEHVAERLSFIQKLRAIEDQLVKNIHFNIPESAAHFFTKFCEESDVRSIVQPDNMAITAVRLITERFQNLTFQCVEHQERGKKLTASTITDDDIRYECNKISQAVREYRRMVDEWMKFTEALAVKGVPRFWEKAPWSVNIHKKLADDYDELMRLIKDLRNATPTGFQSSLPRDDEITKFPRGSLYS